MDVNLHPFSMNHGKYVLSQVMEFVPWHWFDQCVKRYGGHYKVRRLRCWDQFLALSFGQLAYRESLRDVVACLNSHKEKHYHLGLRCAPARSTLALANEKRDWRIYRDLAELLIQEARRLYVDDTGFKLDLDGSVYAIDSTTIDLCLTIFPWASFRKTKAAVKLHMSLDLQGNIPAFFHISEGTVHDVHFLDVLTLESGAYYVMDRGYLDFKRLYVIDQAGAFFVTRAKSNFACERMYSRPVDKSTGLRCDQVIRLTGYRSSLMYPDRLRRISYVDELTGNRYVFLTNNFDVNALTIAELYKHRWQVELFFKWIKQHLKIKCFWGHSQNAVKTQICIAICAYLVVAIMKKKLNIDRHLYEMLQILSVSLFDKKPLTQLFSETDPQSMEDLSQKQANLWEF